MKYKEEAHKHFAPLPPFLPASVPSPLNEEVLSACRSLEIHREASKVHTRAKLRPLPAGWGEQGKIQSLSKLWPPNA